MVEVRINYRVYKRGDIREKLLDKAEKELDFLVDVLRRRILLNIDEMNIVATGYLKRSIAIRKQRRKASLRYDVIVECPYAKYVEFGTYFYTAMPPVDKIKEWVKVKFGLDDKEARDVAWAVAKKIFEEGTPPKPFLRKALFDTFSRYKGKYKYKVYIDRREVK